MREVGKLKAASVALEDADAVAVGGGGEGVRAGAGDDDDADDDDAVAVLIVEHIGEETVFGEPVDFEDSSAGCSFHNDYSGKATVADTSRLVGSLLGDDAALSVE